MAGFRSVVVVLGSVAGRVIFREGTCEFVHQPHQQAIEDRIWRVFADFKAIPIVVPFPGKILQENMVKSSFNQPGDHPAGHGRSLFHCTNFNRKRVATSSIGRTIVGVDHPPRTVRCHVSICVFWSPSL